MAHSCVEVRIQTIQKFYTISLKNGRPDLTTENHRLKEFCFFIWMNEDTFYIKKTEGNKKTFRCRYILIEYKVYFLWGTKNFY